MENNLIYFDNNATTPCDPRVVDTMLPWFYQNPGNAASRSHAFGWKAEEAVDYARGQVADLISVESKEIIFTFLGIVLFLLALLLVIIVVQFFKSLSTF